MSNGFLIAYIVFLLVMLGILYWYEARTSNAEIGYFREMLNIAREYHEESRYPTPTPIPLRRPTRRKAPTKA
ncbi:MAG: hypothetical protein WB116_02115 [Candidatus Dormiibacterota bacterium]